MGAVVVALQVQTIGEFDEGVDVGLHLSASLNAAAPGQPVARGGFDGFAQPGLAYPSEIEVSGLAECRRIPHILVPLPFGRHAESACRSSERVEERLQSVTLPDAPWGMREQLVDGHGVPYERIRLFSGIKHPQEELLPGYDVA
ncbi:hypothetical protein [Streptomyces sp. NPDC091215]|uniref:hypothetical protein n=1 Tax=Streptomyces sp. NPDC091215 TaxID=3155192 RepID=UPI00342742BD